mgnify:CR=1 FL=1
MDALFLWEIRAIVKKSVWKCRILEKTHHLIHLIFESADSNMENIKERKRKRGKEKGEKKKGLFSAPAISRNLNL